MPRRAHEISNDHFGPHVAIGATCRPITQKVLDEFVIYEIPMAQKAGTTTIMFPSQISGLCAKSVATQEQENEGFLISFTPGNFYFTIRALKNDAEDHLTVIFNRKAYVLHLTASKEAFYNVTFYSDDRKGKDSTRIAVVPERLLSLMDKAKAYPLFAKNHPDVLAGVLHSEPGILNGFPRASLAAPVSSAGGNCPANLRFA